jgi:enoyl-CoA hydratase
MSYTAITVERRGAADWVTLNRPERLNALDHAMVEDLRLFRLGRGGVIVLRGAGRVFCAGVDIKETSIARHKDAVESLTEQRRFSEIIRRMRR